MGIEQRYHSLQDFLASNFADVDGVLDSGWGFPFPVKGREINATVLFADISGFSTRTLNMTPVETLIYVQNFFAWITAEALHGRPGIVDKYIGDEVMVVFSEEFGSQDPLADAVQAAAAMSRSDVLAYRPHIGIASGPVVVGYAGTALQYNVSVFGAPVALAARCAGVRPTDEYPRVSSSIVVPSEDWGDRKIEEILPAEHGGRGPLRFVLRDAREVVMRGLGAVSVQEIHNVVTWASMDFTAEDRAREHLQLLQANNRYWPRFPSTDDTQPSRTRSGRRTPQRGVAVHTCLPCPRRPLSHSDDQAACDDIAAGGAKFRH